jgi:hypothetical protein
MQAKGRMTVGEFGLCPNDEVHSACLAGVAHGRMDREDAKLLNQFSEI